MVHFLGYNPGQFSEIYPERTVNNLYFDTPDLDFYRANIEGQASRWKIRLRWYGTGEVKDLQLEFKFKQGLTGSKEVYPMDDFTVLDPMWRPIGPNPFPNLPERAWQMWKHTRPVVINAYKRLYFLSAEGECRATVDSELIFHRASDGMKKSHFPNAYWDRKVVLELKYNTEVGNKIEYITSHLPYRVTRFSKYVAGVDTVWQ